METLEDGGQVLEHLAGTNTGVFIGMMTDDYSHIKHGITDRNLIDNHTATGSAMSINANRISYISGLTQDTSERQVI